MMETKPHAGGVDDIARSSQLTNEHAFGTDDARVIFAKRRSMARTPPKVPAEVPTRQSERLRHSDAHSKGDISH
jgi:hypothetical protein